MLVASGYYIEVTEPGRLPASLPCSSSSHAAMEKQAFDLIEMALPTKAPAAATTSEKKWLVDRVSRRTKNFTLLMAVTALLGIRSFVFLSSPVTSGHPSASSSGIAWSSCPDLTEFECGYLTVPQDYMNPMPNETVSIALRRLPASAPKKDRLGTIFTNPGGPGGSGTYSVVVSGPTISKVTQGRYDVLSWDPRGVNMTTPSIDCYPTEYDEYMQDFKQNQLGLPFQALAEAGPEAELSWFKKTDTYYRAGIASCGRNGNQKMLKSVSTAYMVRDMVSILEALGETEGGLNYWGFSYGTILGATFSAMFPDLVHRVLLDGVSSANLYSTDMFEWGRSGMDDTNKVWEGFLSTCANAGPERCVLAQGNDTAKDIAARISALEERLISEPLEAPFAGKTSGMVSASDVRIAIFKALYAPKTWPRLAKALADADKGDGVTLAEYVNEPSPQGEVLSARRDPLDNIFKRHMTLTWSQIASESIMCSDTEPSVAHSAPSPTSFRDYSHELTDLSLTGELWARVVGRCRVWNVTATEAYRGPWTVEDGLRKTKFPVLFLGVTADPVTPLSAAKSMSMGFGNESATLLIQDGFGHCSTAHPSLCSAKTIAGYFLEGKVPEYGTTCKSDPSYIFPTSEYAEARMSTMSVEDRELMVAMERLSENAHYWR